MLHRPTAVATLAATLALAACGGDDADNDSGQSSAAGDPSRYCRLSADLDAAGEKFFSKLGRDARLEEYQATERRFIKRFSGDIRQIERAAPERIRPDVRKVLDAQRQRAGLKTPSDVKDSEASAAENRVKSYEKRNCPA